MMRALVPAVGALTMLLALNARATEPTVELQRNPFDRPATEALANKAAPVSRNNIADSPPFLRAVLAAGSKSVVNFGGVILQIGESANGYRLLSVEEGGATFSRGGEKIIFSLFEQEQAEEQ